MIVKTFEFSIAAAAPSTNVAPSDYNPIPADGLLDVYAVLDSSIAGLTAPPKIELVRGGQTADTPLRQSSLTGNPRSVQVAGDFADPSVCPVVTQLPVRQAQNLALNLYGGTGATATGRIRMVFRTTAEVQAGVGGVGSY